MRYRIAAALLLVSTALVSCDTPTTPAVDGPQLNYINGPADLFNIERYEATFQAVIVDPESGLRAFAGLPTVPSSFILCQQFGFTGTEQYQLIPMQTVGNDVGPFVHIMTTDGVNLHVYQNAGFNGFCRTTIYAQGVGRLSSTDNDMTFSGTRWNVWGYHLTGEVTVLSTGETKQLNAFVKFRAHPDGGFQILTRKVELN